VLESILLAIRQTTGCRTTDQKFLRINSFYRFEEIWIEHFTIQEW